MKYNNLEMILSYHINEFKIILLYLLIKKLKIFVLAIIELTDIMIKV